MESIIIVKLVEVMISLGGAMIGAFVMKSKKYDNNGCNSGCIVQCETFCNKTSQLVRNLSNKQS